MTNLTNPVHLWGSPMAPILPMSQKYMFLSCSCVSYYLKGPNIPWKAKHNSLAKEPYVEYKFLCTSTRLAKSPK